MNATCKMFEIVRKEGVVIVTPLRDLRELEFQQIQDELRPLADEPVVRAIIVDFGRTDYLGSTALGVLVYMWKRLKERGGQLVLCNVSEHEREIFQVVGFADLWKIYPSREEAMKAVAT